MCGSLTWWEFSNLGRWRWEVPLICRFKSLAATKTSKILMTSVFVSNRWCSFVGQSHHTSSSSSFPLSQACQQHPLLTWRQVIKSQSPLTKQSLNIFNLLSFMAKKSTELSLFRSLDRWNNLRCIFPFQEVCCHEGERRSDVPRSWEEARV